MDEPIIIQGGMGAAVSSWPLAKAVSQTGQLGVVSGTGLDAVLARRLQLGDPGGHIHRALEDFPFSETAQKILDRYYIPGGKAQNALFAPHPIPQGLMSRDGMELCIVGNFVEVYLAKEKHNGIVGINYMEKLQLPTLPSLFGAMLARVDYVLMGAGIPRAIPSVLDQLSEGKPTELSLDVHGAEPSDRFITRFDPKELFGPDIPRLHRPRFLAIVSSAVLATALVRKASGHVDGFILEGPTAGGHNAPPRGPLHCNVRGEPIYGPRDCPDLDVFRSLGRPFWLAGSYDSPEKVLEALNAGATGVQVGTRFAFCEESGLDARLKYAALEMCCHGTTNVFTDPVASPTGFPFKVLSLPQTLSDAEVYEKRQRRCDLGNLRQAYKKPDGTLGWRCPAEHVDVYVAKGGTLCDTMGRKCLCNALLANVGLGQSIGGSQEPPLVTSGDSIGDIRRYLHLRSTEKNTYSAKDVVEHLLPKSLEAVADHGQKIAKKFEHNGHETVAGQFERSCRFLTCGCR
jgi:nitronate monooxygenase